MLLKGLPGLVSQCHRADWQYHTLWLRRHLLMSMLWIAITLRFADVPVRSHTSVLSWFEKCTSSTKTSVSLEWTTVLWKPCIANILACNTILVSASSWFDFNELTSAPREGSAAVSRGIHRMLHPQNPASFSKSCLFSGRSINCFQLTGWYIFVFNLSTDGPVSTCSVKTCCIFDVVFRHSDQRQHKLGNMNHWGD
jgi:hypothetical protein